MKLARLVLATLGVLFVAQGAVQLVQPELLTDLIDIHAGSVTGRTELQVVYGGLHIALGVIVCGEPPHKKRSTRQLR